MSSSTFSKHLSLPLISDLPSQAELWEDDDNNGPKAVRCPALCVEDEDENEEFNDTLYCWKDICSALVLFALLWGQFALLFASKAPSVIGLYLSVVNFTILLLLLSTFIHRHTLHALGLQNVVLMYFAPEILIDVVLGLILFDEVSNAWFVLLQGAICLAGFAIVANLYLLCKINSCEKTAEKEGIRESACPSEEQPNARLAAAQIV